MFFDFYFNFLEFIVLWMNDFVGVAIFVFDLFPDPLPRRVPAITNDCCTESVSLLFRVDAISPSIVLDQGSTKFIGLNEWTSLSPSSFSTVR